MNTEIINQIFDLYLKNEKKNRCPETYYSYTIILHKSFHFLDKSYKIIYFVLK